MADLKIDNFRKLIAWQRGHELLLAVCRYTRAFPREELYGLALQMHRASISIASNIAEGFSRQTKADKLHFYQMSLGSCSEVQGQIIAAHDLHFMSDETYNRLDALSEEAHKIINGLIKSMRCT